MLDYDLAKMYEVETKVLKQAVKRNIERFPDDFMFEVSKNELSDLRSQMRPQVGEVTDTYLSHLLNKA